MVKIKINTNIERKLKIPKTMENKNIVFGIRPVAEAIQSGKQIEKLYVRKGAEGQLMTELRDLAFRHRIRIQEVHVEKLNRLTRLNH